MVTMPWKFQLLFTAYLWNEIVLDVEKPQPTFGNTTRVHNLLFNISSISRDEDVDLAELRLYTLVQQDRDSYQGVHRRVSVYQDSSEHQQLLNSKEIRGSHTGWETFTITSAIRRWVRARTATQLVEVRIESVRDIGVEEHDGLLDIDTRPHLENEPLLVVFSNDKNKDKSHTRELHELLVHDQQYLDEVIDDDDDDDGGGVGGGGGDDDDDGSFNHDYNSVDAYDLRLKRSVDSGNDITSSNRSSRNMLEKLYHRVMIAQTKHQQNSSISRIRREPRRKQRKKRKRNICRRKRMYVDFQDINWHRWIIAPKGYEVSLLNI